MAQFESRQYRPSSSSSGSGGAPFFVIGILLGLAATVAPWFVPAQYLPGMSKTMIMGFGLVLMVLSAILLIVTTLYVKTKPDEAILKTGMGGPRVVIDGGAIIIPVLHETTRVPLHTMKIEVARKGSESLLTKDKLRADVVAAFFIHVQKDEESIKAAAKSLGNWSGEEERVTNLVNDKIVASLRQVAATKTLAELNEDRKGFQEAVQAIMQPELASNGLKLESVNVSHLDQAPLEAMRADSVFDAEGRLTIATQVNQRNVERNAIERKAQQDIKKQDVDTARLVQAQELEQAKIVAETEANKAIAKAEAEAKAKAAAAERAREADVTKAKAEQAVQVAVVEQTKAVAVAEQQKLEAEAVAQVAKDKALELAQREKAIAVAEAEKRRADAQAAQLVAEKGRQEAEQAVLTVAKVAEANRDKESSIIAKQAEAERTRLEQNVSTDVAAYKVTKEAEAAQQAASLQAEARIALAQADKESLVLKAEGEKESLVRKAEGEKAVQMVPVQVNEAQVAVNSAQVDVDIKKLEGQSKNEKIARELSVELARIAAEKDARVAAAQAIAGAFAQADIKVFGDPTTMQRMLGQLFTGQATGTWMEGLNGSVPEEMKNLAGMGTTALAVLAQKLATKLGVNVDPAVLGAVLKDGNKGAGASADAAATDAPKA
ncbi:MAG: hypothetical protein J0M12_05910 [Deltaproteobacteria bacterium]|nr:hypothetical protein [Deltaproteobacteria bacterium]